MFRKDLASETIVAYLPSGCHRRSLIQLVCPSSAKSKHPRVTCHTQTVLSRPALANRSALVSLPPASALATSLASTGPALNARACTMCSWCSSVVGGFQVPAIAPSDHSFKQVLLPPHASQVPSGDVATARTQSSCPSVLTQ